MNGIQFGWYTVYMDNKVVNSLITSRNSKIPFSSSCLSQENEADGEKEKENKSKFTNRIEKNHKLTIDYKLIQTVRMTDSTKKKENENLRLKFDFFLVEAFTNRKVASRFSPKN